MTTTPTITTDDGLLTKSGTPQTIQITLDSLCSSETSVSITRQGAQAYTQDITASASTYVLQTHTYIVASPNNYCTSADLNFSHYNSGGSDYNLVEDVGGVTPPISIGSSEGALTVNYSVDAATEYISVINLKPIIYYADGTI